MGQNLTKIMNLFFRDQGISLDHGVRAVLGFKGVEKEWKRPDNDEKSELERGNLERVLLDMQNKEMRLEVKLAGAGDRTLTLKSAT